MLIRLTWGELARFDTEPASPRPASQHESPSVRDRNFLSPLASMLLRNGAGQRPCGAIRDPFCLTPGTPKEDRIRFTIGVDSGLRSGDRRIRATQTPPERRSSGEAKIDIGRSAAGGGLPASRRSARALACGSGTSQVRGCVDLLGLGDERDDAHFFAASGARQWLDF